MLINGVWGIMNKMEQCYIIKRIQKSSYFVTATLKYIFSFELPLICSHIRKQVTTLANVGGRNASTGCKSCS